MKSAIKARYVAGPMKCPSCGLVFTVRYDHAPELCRDCAHHRWQADYRERYYVYAEQGYSHDECRENALQDVGHFQY